MAATSSSFAGARVEPDRGQAKLAVGHQGHDVDGGRGPLEPFQVGGRRGPVQGHGAVVPVDDAARQAGILYREAAVTAVADDLRGHPLVDGADRPRVHQQGVVGVAVHVDEARRHGEAPGVELDGRLCVELAHVGDAALSDRHVGLGRSGARAVEDEAAADDQIRGHGVSPYDHGIVVPARKYRRFTTVDAER